MKNCTVTVYISSHNYGKYLQEAINSVLNQNIDNWELLLFNDGSTDDTDEIIEIYKGDKRIRTFKTNNIGLPAVANLALKNARGKYLIRLDADDLLDDNILLVLSHYLDSNPDVALVFPDYYLIDDQDGLIRVEKRNSIYQSSHVLDAPANGACTMIRTTILKKIGGYREDLKAQDGYDIWTKIVGNYKCRNINLPLFYYRRHGGNLTENTLRIITARRAIKKDAVALLLDKFRPIISIIPCRKNYDIYPNLWEKKFGVETLLDNAIQVSIASSVFDEIVIASDTPEVKNIIKKYSDKRLSYIHRPSKFSIPSCNIAYTLEHVLKNLGINSSGISVLSYLQAPFTSTANLEEAVFTLVMHDADSSFAVEEINFALFKRTSNGITTINNTDKFRSDFDVVYRDTRTSFATLNKNLKTGSISGSRIINFVVPGEETFFIHTKRDFETANFLKKFP